MKIAVITSEYNKNIIDRLITGVKKAFKDNTISTEDVEFFKVPGAFEIPYKAQKLIDTKKFAGIITLGCVIKGETDHYKAVCDGVTYGIQKISIENRIPIMFGVLMCNSPEQSFSRSSLENMKYNKGYECVKALLEMI
jgi:6,7-dimethyl-8-ribityllumazine synthase